jgi:histidyl-tRNA synthetase
MVSITEQNLTYKGTQITIGNEKRNVINKMIEIVTPEFTEISIPIIQFQETFENKVGEENNNMMYNFKDRGNRDLCLAPEYTSVIQKLALNRFKYEKDLKLFYVQQCFRGENPQRGRYREFTQFGIEIINPTEKYDLWKLAIKLCMELGFGFDQLELNLDITRGLDYYKEGKGFEIRIGKYQLCGGGEYKGGVGFAIGVDRGLELNLGF